MKKERGVYVWVHPDFKRTLKVKAADENKSIISLTKEMAGFLPERKKRKDEGYLPRF